MKDDPDNQGSADEGAPPLLPERTVTMGGALPLPEPPADQGRSSDDGVHASSAGRHGTIGRYEVIYPVGSGGMASVYMGRLGGPAGFEKYVAIKLIHPHLAGQKRFVEMFLDEARLSAKIHHPNVCEVSEVAQENDQYYMVGEFVLGQSLDKLMERLLSTKMNLPLGCCAQICAQICYGLHAAHETRDGNERLLNLVHRDMSPQNVLISYEGLVKIIDFGIAWARDRITQTESGLVKGNFAYVSPEQILGRKLDRRSDLFSLGVILYKLTTQRHPFDCDSQVQRINKIVAGSFVRPGEVDPSIHPSLEGIILRAMASSPEARYASAEIMGKKLEDFARSTGDDISNMAFASLMKALFRVELEDHQAKLSAFQRFRVEQSAGLPDPGEFSLSPGAPEIRKGSNSALRPVSAELLPEILPELLAPRRFWREGWLTGILIGLAIAALAWVFWYASEVQNQRARVDAMIQQTTTAISPSPGAGRPAETVAPEPVAEPATRTPGTHPAQDEDPPLAKGKKKKKAEKKAGKKAKLPGRRSDEPSEDDSPRGPEAGKPKPPDASADERLPLPRNPYK